MFILLIKHLRLILQMNKILFILWVKEVENRIVQRKKVGA